MTIFSHEFEHADACISLVIPGIMILYKHVSKPVIDDESRSVKKVHEQLAASLNTQFSCVESWELHSMAILLDPHLKVEGFSSAPFAELAKSKIEEKAKDMTNPLRERSGSSEETQTRTKQSSLWGEFDKDDTEQPVSLSEEENELQQYLSMPHPSHDDDPLKFWIVHETHFRCLCTTCKEGAGYSTHFSQV